VPVSSLARRTPAAARRARATPPKRAGRTGHGAASALLARRLPAVESRLDVSRAVVSLFLRAKTSDFSVEELAKHVGISPRTFYRYFPRKEDAIRPRLDDDIQRLAASIKARPRRESLREALAASYAAFWTPGELAEWKVLEAVLSETDLLRAVWLQIITDSERMITEVAVERLGLAVTSRRARLIGNVTVAAVRVAMTMVIADPRLDAASVLRDNLRELGPAFFAPAKRPSAPAKKRASRRASR
jgi:AcrR family transcriptional regulator